VALVGAHAGLAAARWQDLTAALAGISVAVLGAALWKRRSAGIPAAILLAGMAYGVSVASSDPTFDRASALVAALLLLAAELGFWSLELAAPIRYEPAILARRLVLITALGLGALCAAGVVAAAAARDADPSLLLEGFGVVAAIVIVAGLAGLARAHAPGKRLDAG
jgi:hypothetical protein